jgi:hypothetical protein
VKGNHPSDPRTVFHLGTLLCDDLSANPNVSCEGPPASGPFAFQAHDSTAPDVISSRP